jgi:hypothetical protein
VFEHLLNNRDDRRQDMISGMARWTPLVAMAGLVGCSDTAGPQDGGTVAVRFAAGQAAAGAGQGANGTLRVAGTNGVLEIEEVRLVIREFELERVDDSCDDDDDSGRGSPDGGLSASSDDDDCDEFRGGAAFVDLPLDGDDALAVRQPAPPGVYDELELEIRRIEDDDDDDHRGVSTSELLAMIRAEIPDWPTRASVMVAGTFTPAGGAPRAFRTFLRGEIEIEMDLEPPLVVEDDDASIVVELDPAQWFRRATGSVVDLSAFDFDSTGLIAEFEVQLKDGFLQTQLHR